MQIKKVIYDEHSTADSMAGYDSLSEVHVCPMSFKNQLQNVTEADTPIYLNQVLIVLRHFRLRSIRTLIDLLTTYNSSVEMEELTKAVDESNSPVH